MPGWGEQKKGEEEYGDITCGLYIYTYELFINAVRFRYST